MTNGNDKCRNCGGDRAIHHYQTDQCPVGGVEASIDRKQEWKTATFASIPFDPPVRLARDMTVREHFAAMAMQANFSNLETLKAYSNRPGDLFHTVAEASVLQADALIAALSRPMCPDCKTRFADDGHYDAEHKICPDYERAWSERE